jgi:putative ABC transport system substrate-binding protein
MRRRDLLILVAGATILRPPAAPGQQKAMPVVGFLVAGSVDPNPMTLLTGPVHQGLSEMGHIDGENYTVEYRAAEGHYERLPELAADLVSRKVAVIVTQGGLPPALAAKSATSTIPIVFANLADPVGTGLVASLARPGGNVTGFANVSLQLHPKRLELLSELVPEAMVIALLVNPNNQNTEHVVSDVKEAAHAKRVQLPVLKASTEAEIDDAFGSLNELHAGALVVEDEAFFYSRRGQLVALASRHNVPASYGAPEFAVSGGLMSYGIDWQFLNRQAGIYAGRILKGEKPAELSVQQPSKFELVINLKTARALGLTVPQSLLARADEVIE